MVAKRRLKPCKKFAKDKKYPKAYKNAKRELLHQSSPKTKEKITSNLKKAYL